jgi:hypothetical protein
MMGAILSTLGVFLGVLYLQTTTKYVLNQPFKPPRLVPVGGTKLKAGTVHSLPAFVLFQRLRRLSSPTKSEEARQVPGNLGGIYWGTQTKFGGTSIVAQQVHLVEVTVFLNF